MSPRLESTSRIRVRVRPNENKAPTAIAPPQTRRKRSVATAGLPYSNQRTLFFHKSSLAPNIRPGHLYVRPAVNRNHTGERGRLLQNSPLSRSHFLILQIFRNRDLPPNVVSRTLL